MLMMDVLDSVLDALLRAVVVRGDLAPPCGRGPGPRRDRSVEAELDLVLAAIEGLRLATTLPHGALDCQAAQQALARLARLVALVQDRLTSAS